MTLEHPRLREAAQSAIAQRDTARLSNTAKKPIHHLGRLITPAGASPTPFPNNRQSEDLLTWENNPLSVEVTSGGCSMLPGDRQRIRSE